VWRLEFEPGTNSVEVHVSRLRAKLAPPGSPAWSRPTRGGYRVRCARERCAEPFAAALCLPNSC
jgi:DNA-binding response OmpR family regulator